MNKLNKSIFVGHDSSDNPHFVDLPEIWVPYRKAIDKGIQLSINSKYERAVSVELVRGMKDRNILHQFLEKYITEIIESVGTEDGLDSIMRLEAKNFITSQEEQIFEDMYAIFKKEFLIESIVFKYLNKKLVEYRERLDSVPI